MTDLKNHGLLLGLIILVTLASPVAAFGAGNIGSTSKVEGQNCSSSSTVLIRPMLTQTNPKIFIQGDTVTSKMPCLHWPWLGL